MALSLWSLADIKSKVRKLTGRPSTNQLSDSNLLDYINRYYQIIFPMEVRPLELQTWFETTLTAGTDEYTLSSLSFDDSYLTIENPVTINGYSMTLYLNPTEFYSKWPETETYGNSRPVDVLLYNNMFTFRYPPDSTYVNFKAAAWTRPTALSSDGDYPIREEWGPVIAYGTAREILEDNSEIETLQIISGMYETHIIQLMRKRHQQEFNQRSIPTF